MPDLVAPHPDVHAAWEATLLRWDEKQAHDRMLASARQNDAYAWLAARYAEGARSGDRIAQRRLLILRRVIELTGLTRSKAPTEPMPYGKVFRLLTALLVMLGLGFALARTKAQTSALTRSHTRDMQRGSAMLVVMILITALFAGAAVLTALQMSTGRAAGVSGDSRAATACAEAGLVAARPKMATSWPSINAALAAGSAEPSFFSSVSHDLDNDGNTDFTLSIRDNEDELGSNDPTRDNDLTVFLVSTCTKYPDTPVAVLELVRFNGGVACYDQQLGGCGGNNNAN